MGKIEGIELGIADRTRGREGDLSLLEGDNFPAVSTQNRASTQASTEGTAVFTEEYINEEYPARDSRLPTSPATAKDWPRLSIY